MTDYDDEVVDPTSDLPVMQPGMVVRTKSFTADFHNNEGQESLSLTYRRSQADDIPGQYFVSLLLGVDDGPDGPDAVDVDEFLADRGYFDIFKVAAVVKDIDMTKTEEEIVAEFSVRLREAWDRHH